MKRWLSGLVLLLALAGLSGCATSDGDDVSARPWNSPRYWETGLPSGMYDGR